MDVGFSPVADAMRWQCLRFALTRLNPTYREKSHYLQYPEKLAMMRSQLRRVRGEAGAADKLAVIVGELIQLQHP